MCNLSSGNLSHIWLISVMKIQNFISHMNIFTFTDLGSTRINPNDLNNLLTFLLCHQQVKVYFSSEISLHPLLGWFPEDESE